MSVKLLLLCIVGLSLTTRSFGADVNLPEEEIDYSQTNSKQQNTQKTTWLAQLIRVKTDQNYIPGLIFELEKNPVVLVRSENKFRPLVTLKGVIKSLNQDSVLVLENKFKIPLNSQSGVFKFNVYLTSKKNEINLSLKNKGQVFNEKIFLVSPEAEEYNVVSPWDSIRVSIGSTYFNYNQTGYVPFYSWVGNLALRYHSPEKLDYFGFNTDLEMTVLTVKSNQNNYAPQVGQYRFELMYFDEWKENPQYKLHYLLGGTYLTMLSNGATFGFKNLLAPDVGVRVRKITGEQTDIAATLRLALMDTKLLDRGIELEIGTGYVFKNSHRGETGVKYLDYAYSPDKNKDQVSLKMITFFISYTL